MNTIYKRLKLAYVGVYLLLFLTFYLPGYVFEIESFNYDYFRMYLFGTVTFIMSTLAASLVFTRHITEQSSIWTEAVGYVLPGLVYALPYYYLYAQAYGYDWIECITISILVCLVESVIRYGAILLMHLIMLLLVRKAGGRVAILTVPELKRKDIPKEYMQGFFAERDRAVSEYIRDRSVFDTSSTIVQATFTAFLVRFGYGLAGELYNTVTYLISYRGTYRPEEILSMVIAYAVLLIQLVAATAIANLLRRAIVKRYDEDSETE